MDSVELTIKLSSRSASRRATIDIVRVQHLYEIIKNSLKSFWVQFKTGGVKLNVFDDNAHSKIGCRSLTAEVCMGSVHTSEYFGHLNIGTIAIVPMFEWPKFERYPTAHSKLETSAAVERGSSYRCYSPLLVQNFKLWLPWGHSKVRRDYRRPSFVIVSLTRHPLMSKRH